MDDENTLVMELEKGLSRGGIEGHISSTRTRKGRGGERHGSGMRMGEDGGLPVGGEGQMEK